MANFDQLKAAIRAAIYENTEQAITGDAMQSTLIDMVDAMNTAKQDALTLTLPLAYDGDGALTLKYDEFQFDLGGDDVTLTLRLAEGFETSSDGVRVYAGRGLSFGDEGVLEANPGDGLAFDASGAIVPDFAFVQSAISDLATIRSGAAAGATAVQPADVSDCVRSASVSTIVTLSQAEYDALANKDANTFYIII